MLSTYFNFSFMLPNSEGNEGKYKMEILPFVYSAGHTERAELNDSSLRQVLENSFCFK